ncbi:hypothetical protein [Streptomyces sp. NPDC050507]|uniref:hypothetical protein n=1 Tax=Streptomyces sp. NPDC050507 TaxID=3365619 RepID=UPI0037A1109A
MVIPGWLLVHTVEVAPFEGDGAYGPVYGATATVRGFLDEQTRLVRSPGGDEITSTSTVYTRLTETIPAKSRITLPGGRTTTVIAALRRDGGGLATPDHLEVQLL